MKKIILAFMVAASMFGCKKNASGPTQFALSKIYENGDLETEFIYNGDGSLKQVKYYTQPAGTSVLHTLEEYKYDKEGNLKEVISYSMPGKEVSSSGTFILDAAGRISRASYHYGEGTDSGEVYLHIDHEYNKDGFIKKQTWRSPDEKITNYRDFVYHANGNMKSVTSFKVNGLSQKKFYSHSFAASDMVTPATLVKPIAYPVNYYYDYMLTLKIESLGFDNSGVQDDQYEMHMTERETNGNGFVTKQKLTLKHINPAGADEITTMQFDWKKL